MAQRQGRTAVERRTEWLKCSLSFPYWCDRWAQVYDAASRSWLPFHLWPSQVEVAETLQAERLVVMLKARQLGMSWLGVAYGLWLMLFRPAATVLIFSKRDNEAVDLLSVRLRGMYERLPRDMRHEAVVVDNSHEVRLSNGSAALAFPTTGGRSYTGTYAMVDEADYVSAGGGDLEALLDAVKPTIDGGGQLVLLSTVDKGAPGSAFKRIYQAAKEPVGGANPASSNGWVPVFLPWTARPDRDAAWYEAVKADILARSGSLDSLYAEYPATDVEALAPRATDARFAAEWCSAADDTRGDRSGLGKPDRPGPSLANLVVWEEPAAGRMYVIGADPAEGNPQSDESAACVMDAATGDQVAVWAGRFEPATFAHGLLALADWYRTGGRGRADVGILVERNNHGHAVLMALREAGAEGLLRGEDGRLGWLTNARGKTLAVTAAADLLRDGAATGRPPKVRDVETLRQIVALSGSTLSSPPGDHDDRCIAWCLAAVAAKQSPAGPVEAAVIPPAWEIDTGETGGW